MQQYITAKHIARTQKVRAFRGMKRILIITIALFVSCSTTKRTQPCRQCPQYTNYEYPINDVKLSPEYLQELRTNLTKVGIWVKSDTIK